jgi:hypothetical protein
MEGIFNQAVEMSSGAVIYVPSFIKTGSGIQTLMGGGYAGTHRRQRDLLSLLYFFKISGLIKAANMKISDNAPKLYFHWHMINTKFYISSSHELNRNGEKLLRNLEKMWQ